jgi:hypothetical protein
MNQGYRRLPYSLEALEENPFLTVSISGGCWHFFCILCHTTFSSPVCETSPCLLLPRAFMIELITQDDLLIAK